MESRIHADIRKDAKLLAVVERATEMLRGDLGPSVDLAVLDWKLADDARGHPALELAVSDGIASAVGRLTAKEWTDTYRLHGRLLRIWGDVLQNRNHKQLAHLRQLIGELETVGGPAEN